MSLKSSEPSQPRPKQPPQEEQILCCHCQRTATNGIKCQGICVADSSY
ncbi:MAG: hypothetical protein SFT94_02585 [Pseudanabaenaceae cyanobacterium bins.68]|nr:hypothetical protein [Pseudanabaenaceae cyanobacterium bins.68]